LDTALAACVLVCLALVATAEEGSISSQNTDLEPIPGLAEAEPLDVEFIGDMPGKVIVEQLGPYKIPGTDDYVVLLSNYSKRGFPDVGKKVFFRSLKLRSGTLREHPPVGALNTNIHKQFLWNGKLYVPLNVPTPDALAIYDLTADTLTTAKDLFVEPNRGPFSFCPAEDDTIALGTASPPEISLYDTKTGKVTKYGKVGPPGAGYVYTITQNNDFIYGATRGQAPWHVVAINKKTGEKTVALEVPQGGYLSVGAWGGRCTARASMSDGKKGKRVIYGLVEGKAVVQEEPPAPQKRSKREPPPEILIDDTTALATQEVTIHWRSPEDKPEKEDPSAPAEENGWKRLTIKARVSGVLIHRVVSLDGKTVIATASPYGQMVTYKTKSGEFEMLGRPTSLNVYSMASDGEHAYISGYPGMGFARIDFGRPFTTDKSYPGKPGIPWADGRANPRMMMRLGDIVAGAHCGVFMYPGADSRIYTCGMCFRHNAGFALGWYDPQTEKFGKFDDAMLKHQQVAWMTPLEGGKKFAVATRVQYKEYKGGTAPKCGRIFLFDTAEQKFMRVYEPLPDVQKLSCLADVGDGKLLGIAPTSLRRGSPTLLTIVYLLDLASGKAIRKRTYQGQMVGAVDKFDTPRKGHDFITGPDGFVWTMMGRESMTGTTALLRINPKDLSVRVVGTVTGDWNRFIFIGNDLYLGGADRLRRIRGIVRD